MNDNLKKILNLEEAGGVLTDCEPGRAHALFEIIDINDPAQVKLLELVRSAEEAKTKLVNFVNVLKHQAKTPEFKEPKSESQLLYETFKWLKENGSIVGPTTPRMGGVWSADRWVHPSGMSAILADDGYTRIVSGGGLSVWQTADRPVEYSDGASKEWLESINYMLTNHAYPKNL